MDKSIPSELDTPEEKSKLGNIVIRPVKEPESFIKPKVDIHPLIPNPYDGELILIIGSIRAGKSTLIANFLHQKALWGDVWGDNVTIISNTIRNCAVSRFNLERWNSSCFEMYDDNIIINLRKSQEEKKKLGHDEGFLLLLDDICGSISNSVNSKKGREVVSFATRFRHYTERGNPVCILLSNQKFLDISTVMRCNATGVFISGAIKNKKELQSIREEYADSCGGEQLFDSFIKRNQEAPYSWLYLRLSTSPCQVILNFNERLF
jgi:hypothetical protein